MKARFSAWSGRAAAARARSARRSSKFTVPNSGSIRFRDQELVGLSKAEYLKIRRQLQYVYQDAGAALDPRWKIKNSLDEAMVIHSDMTREERSETAIRTMRSVGLRPEHMEFFPHELRRTATTCEPRADFDAASEVADPG